MIFKSLVFAQASGSTGGLVYSRNAGGMYVRSRANPTNPNTAPQTVVRDAMRELTNAWTNVLSDVQRESWNLYAFNTPTLNKLGEPTSKTGQQMFIRSGIARIQCGLGYNNSAPVIFDLGSFTPVVDPIADVSAQTISIPFTSGDPWVNADGAAMLVYMGRPQNKTRHFGKGPYQLLTAILGDNTTPPTSPVVVASLFPMDLNQRIFLKINVTQDDGRYSNPQHVDTETVA